VEEQHSSCSASLAETRPRHVSKRQRGRSATCEEPPLTRGNASSGGETRTHNLRINSPIRPDPLTRRNARKHTLSRHFDCSSACSILHRFSPSRVLCASWMIGHGHSPGDWPLPSRSYRDRDFGHKSAVDRDDDLEPRVEVMIVIVTRYRSIYEPADRHRSSALAAFNAVGDRVGRNR
jgi:hypothetical protein